MLGARFSEQDHSQPRDGKAAVPHRSDGTGVELDAAGQQLASSELSAIANTASVSSIMTTKVISFKVDTSVEEATRVMLERGISGAPVLDESGRPVGMLSKTDLLEAWHEHGPVVSDAEEHRHGAMPSPASPDADDALVQARERPMRTCVGDIMVPYLLAVSNKAPISLASALMAYEGVHRLLVLNETNEMVGIISALDVLRWLAQLSGFCLPRYTQRQRG